MLKAEKRHTKRCRFKEYDRTQTKCRCSYQAIGMLNGAFLDGHARLVSDEAWNRVGRDGRGYYYWIAAADR